LPAILKVLSFALTCKSQSKQIMSVLRSFNFQKWLDENRDLLKPPVANKNLTPDSDEYIVMVVAGPNARKDYHYNETEEFFYQLEGNITVNVQIDGKVESLNLGPGDMMTVPAKVPHSPVRHEGSIGLVIERVREGKGFTDGLLWYCGNCNHKLHDTYFELKNIETDFLPRFKEYYSSLELRTCNQCGTTMETDSRFV
jgi:3-hydroxyanthranilate 3,4-dioxygenase